MPWYNEEMVGFGFSFFLSLTLLKRETNSMQILDLIFQCWLVSEDPGMKRWLLVKQDSSWSAGNREEIFWWWIFFSFIFFL